jgi:putative ABC transport system permease protein
MNDMASQPLHLSSVRVAWQLARLRPLPWLLNALLLTLALAGVTVALLVQHHTQRVFERDLAGVDLVVGAKGSPLQLILAGVLHIDVPPGNVPLQAVQELAAHPQVERLVPLSLGDSFRGWRIVGTTLDYPALYGVQLAAGQWWQPPASSAAGVTLPSVLGAQVAQAVGAGVGARFVGTHGLAEGGHAHGDHPYEVVGLMAPCRCVLDRLILTSTEAVWRVHEDATATSAEDREVMAAEREVTLALIQYRSPLAAVSLPRFVNQTTVMQAAAPALEITRLLSMLGVGAQVLQAFALAMLVAAGISVWIAFAAAVRERAPDLAMLRLLGAPPHRIAGLLALEAAALASVASASGLLLGMLATSAIGLWLAQQRSLAMDGFAWLPELWWVPLTALVLAALAVAGPLWQAYRTDVQSLLLNPR